MYRLSLLPVLFVSSSVSVSSFFFCWMCVCVWWWRGGGEIMTSFICNNSFTYVLRIIILDVSETARRKATRNNNGLSHVPSKRKEGIKSGISLAADRLQVLLLVVTTDSNGNTTTLTAAFTVVLSRLSFLLLLLLLLLLSSSSSSSSSFFFFFFFFYGAL